MKSSFRVPLGYSSIGLIDSPREILGKTVTKVRFHLGYVGGSAHLKITRLFLFGLFRKTWEVIGEHGSMHRLPNGSVVRIIGDQKPNEYDTAFKTGKVLFTTIEFETARWTYLGAHTLQPA